MSILGVEGELTDEGLDAFEYLGRGGSGTVWRAEDPALGRTVAVKVLHHVDVTSGGDTVEARLQAALSWHSNVLSLYSSGTTASGAPYLVLEYADGGSLAERVRTDGALESPMWLRIASELASALAAAHSRGVVHCDVKPSNVLLAADGSVRLADFGIARNTSISAETIEQFAGSLAYAPPELLEGVRPSPPNDVYGLGLIVWFSAMGHHPFTGDDDSPAALMARIQASDVRFDGVAGVPAHLVDLLNRSVARDPGRRPSAGELQRALAGAAGGGDGADRPPERSPGRFPGRRVAAMAVVVALLASALTVARWSTPGDASEPAPDLCEEYATVLEERVELFEEVSADLELSQSPTDVVERLLVKYPMDFARMVRPLLLAAAAVEGEQLQVTDMQMAQAVRASVLQSLTGGKTFYFDGQTGEFDPAALPGELLQPVQAFSEANAVADERCGLRPPDLAAARARMYSAIFSNLANPGFMEGFFADPRSYEIFDTSLVLVLVSTARDFAESLLDGHWQWFVDLLSRDEQTRVTLALESPDIFLTAMAEDPTVAGVLTDPEWVDPIRAGFERSGPSERAGMRALYAPQVALLGLEDPT